MNQCSHPVHIRELLLNYPIPPGCDGKELRKAPLGSPSRPPTVVPKEATRPVTDGDLRGSSEKLHVNRIAWEGRSVPWS